MTQPAPEKFGNAHEDSAVTVLHHLNEERGRTLSDADYAELRASVLEELSHGAQLRPFTWFTFGIIVLGLVVMIAVGIVTARSHALRDHLLTIVSTIALLVTVGFVWNLVRGVRLESERSLEVRLAELDELNQRMLITPEEYQNIRAHILIARQTRATK